jgi:hypothetical protein
VIGERPLGPIVTPAAVAGKNKMACLWRGESKQCEEHFIAEMVLTPKGDAEGRRARPDPHFFLDFLFKEPYI